MSLSNISSQTAPNPMAQPPRLSAGAGSQNQPQNQPQMASPLQNGPTQDTVTFSGKRKRDLPTVSEFLLSEDYDRNTLKALETLLKAGASPNRRSTEVADEYPSVDSPAGTDREYDDTPLHTLARAVLEPDDAINNPTTVKMAKLLKAHGADPAIFNQIKEHGKPAREANQPAHLILSVLENALEQPGASKPEIAPEITMDRELLSNPAYRQNILNLLAELVTPDTVLSSGDQRVIDRWIQQFAASRQG